MVRSYKRVKITGGAYFFAVNLAERHDNGLLIRRMADLREALRRTRQQLGFTLALTSAVLLKLVLA